MKRWQRNDNTNKHYSIKIINTIVIFVCIVCTGQRKEIFWNKRQLIESFFSEEVYADNFIKVDKKYLTAKNERDLKKVVFYNESISVYDSSHAIKPIFKFCRDSIVDIHYKVKDKTIQLIEDTMQNGLFIKFKNFHNMSYGVSGYWHNGVREGLYFECDITDSVHIVLKEYNNGKILMNKIISNSVLRSVR